MVDWSADRSKVEADFMWGRTSIELYWMLSFSNGWLCVCVRETDRERETNGDRYKKKGRERNQQAEREDRSTCLTQRAWESTEECAACSLCLCIRCKRVCRPTDDTVRAMGNGIQRTVWRKAADGRIMYTITHTPIHIIKIIWPIKGSEKDQLTHTGDIEWHFQNAHSNTSHVYLSSKQTVS